MIIFTKNQSKDMTKDSGFVEHVAITQRQMRYFASVVIKCIEEVNVITN